MSYEITLQEAFEKAVKGCAQININPGKMAGAPCIADYRIPVYCILDVLLDDEEALKSVLKYYNHLTLEQIKEAIGFASDVISNRID